MKANSHNLDSSQIQGKDTKIDSTNKVTDIDTPMDDQNSVQEEQDLQSKVRKKQDKEKVVYNAVELQALGNIEPKYLMKPIFPQKGTAVLAGKPDIGKSQLARQLCIHVALGERSFLGFDLTPVHNRAIYVATEDNQEATTYLMSKQFKGLKKEPIENLRFILADTLEQSEIIKELDKELKRSPADLVVVDSFGDIFTGNDTNNNAAMRKAVKPFDIIAKKHNCLMLFVHHINKGAYSQAPKQEQIQGGSGLTQKVRLAIVLSDAPGGKRFFTVVKGNYCPKEYKEYSLELDFSEETFLFINTGNRVLTSSLGTQTGSKEVKKKNDLEKIATKIFTGSVELTNTEIENLYCEITGQSESTAQRKIKSLVKNGYIELYKGKYRLENNDKDGSED